MESQFSARRTPAMRLKSPTQTRRDIAATTGRPHGETQPFKSGPPVSKKGNGSRALVSVASRQHHDSRADVAARWGLCREVQFVGYEKTRRATRHRGRWALHATSENSPGECVRSCFARRVMGGSSECRHVCGSVCSTRHHRSIRGAVMKDLRWMPQKTRRAVSTRRATPRRELFE